MNKIKKVLLIWFIAYLLILPIGLLIVHVTPHINRKEAQEIINTLSQVNNRDVVLTYSWWVFTNEKEINVNELTYNGRNCKEIGVDKERIYAMTEYKQDGVYTIDLLMVDYDDNTITFFDKIDRIDNSIVSKYVYNNCIYLKTSKKLYVYDIKEKTYSINYVDGSTNFRELRKQNYQYAYKILNTRFAVNNIEITKKTTGEKKTITIDDLNYFKEGQYILSLEKYLNENFFDNYYEKDGEIYLACKIPIGGIPLWGWVYVVFHYDFDSDKLSYYSCINYIVFESCHDFYVF